MCPLWPMMSDIGTATLPIEVHTPQSLSCVVSDWRSAMNPVYGASVSMCRGLWVPVVKQLPETFRNTADRYLENIPPEGKSYQTVKQKFNSE